MVSFARPPSFNFAGSNLVCTAIHLALSRLFDEHAVGGKKPFIKTLVAQVDNCVGMAARTNMIA
jgi:hypothetical protein